MVDVFISYSRRDQPMVAQIAQAIEREGYSVWWDAELPPHQSYGDVITAKIAEARAALVVWSADAVKSEWVRAEADMARNQRKLIQTSLDSVMPPLPFNQIQYAELSGWQGEADHGGWRKVRRSLADLCGPRDGDDAAPPVIPPPIVATAAPSPPDDRPASPASSTWPLFAGIGIGAVALAVAGGVLLGQRGGAPETLPVAAESAAPTSSAPEMPAEVKAVAADPAPSVAEEAAAPVDDGGVAVAPNPADMTIPDSSTRLIAVSEIASMGPSTLKVARGEILARKGVRFRDPWLTEWFSRYAWYKPRFDRVQLTDIEKRNIALIRQAEARYGQ